VTFALAIAVAGIEMLLELMVLVGFIKRHRGSGPMRMRAVL
jgi:hypothetical protein